MFGFSSRKGAKTPQKNVAPWHLLRLRSARVCVGFVFFILLALPPMVMAQTEGIQSSVDYAFGQVVNFNLALNDASNVEQVTLFFKAPEFENTYVADVELTGNAVTYPVDLNQVRLAPFTTVTYWWRIQNKDGSTITVPEQTFSYIDDQFEWQTLAQDGVTVYWTGDDTGLGQLAHDIVMEAQPKLSELIPNAPDSSFDVYVYPSSADLRAALRLTGRDWVGAHAHPELGVLLVTAVNSRTAASDLRQSIPHEMVHYDLYRVLGPNYENLPAWFNEGLASLIESNPNPNYELVLETAVARQDTISFNQLCERFPLTEEQAVLAYAQSLSLLEFIQDKYGNSGIQQLIVAYANGGDCDSGVTQALGVNMAELEQAWLRSQQVRSPLAQFFIESGVWLLLIAGGFVIAGLLFMKH
jgi:hypothetical protein